jgi:hypothetical protein
MKTTKEQIIKDITTKVELKLISEKIQLGLVDNLKKNVEFDNKNIKGLQDKMNTIVAEIKTLQTEFTDASKGIKTTSGTYDRMVEMANELGIGSAQIENLPEVKQYDKNAVTLTEVLRFINKHK